jgi:hypothetical protein
MGALDAIVKALQGTGNEVMPPSEQPVGPPALMMNALKEAPPEQPWYQPFSNVATGLARDIPRAANWFGEQARKSPEAAQADVRGAVEDVASIPKRLYGASEQMRTEGPYNPAPAVEAVTTLMGGAPLVAEKGAAGVFGGRLAMTADLKALHEAQKMEAAAFHPENIWKDTDWFRHPVDTKWRFEIPDNASALRYQAGNPNIPDRSVVAGPLTEMMRHNQAFKAYPELRHTRMETRHDPIAEGSWAPPPHNGPLGIIEVNAPDLVSGRDVALHEMQHAIQHIEGFSPGSMQTIGVIGLKLIHIR